MDTVELGFTVCSEDGCTISWETGGIASKNLGLGARSIKQEVKEEKITEPNERCHKGRMECKIFTFDIEYVVELRISVLRLLTLNTIRVTGWIKIP